MFIGFLDYMGVGLVFPLLTNLLFDPEHSILPSTTSAPIRGLWMGILIALTPLVQFFASPILGSLSDQRGRKTVIFFGLLMGLIAYLLGVIGIQMRSLPLFMLYRSLFGICAATMTVSQAAMVDISTKESKARNFGLLNMALGTGFTFGPFLGGILSDSTLVSWFGYTTPFILGGALTALNLILLQWNFSETKKVSEKTKLDFFRGIRHAKEAFIHPVLRTAFISFFLFLFGWDYFMEFIPVTLKTVFHFSTREMGLFFGLLGLVYALAGGILVGPLVKRYQTTKLLNVSMLSCGLYVFLFLFIKNPLFLWLMVPLSCLIVALFFPVASTYVSDNAAESKQGEALGLYHSVQSLALVLSPLFSGPLVGAIPYMPIYMGSCLPILGGLIFIATRKARSVHSVDEA